MRKTFILILIFILQVFNVLSQNTENSIPFSISYYGNYFIQPGIKVGTKIKIKELNKEKGSEVISRALFISPQLGVFSRVNDNTNYLINIESGIRKQKNNKNFYSAYSIGLGYLIQAQLLSFSVDLSNGNHSEKLKETRHFLMPTLNYEFGGKIKNNLGWYSKFSLGSKLFGLDESSMVLFTEFGVNISMNKKN